VLGNRLLGALAISMCLTATTSGRLIGDKVARKLASEALAVRGINVRGFVLVPYVNDSAPDFYSYQALAQSSNSNGSLGFFAVNAWTGDVWNIDTCSRVSSPALQKDQQSILKRSGMSPLAATTLRERSPGCRPD